MSVDLTVVIGLLGCAVSVGSFFFGRTTAAEKAGKNEGEILTEIRNINCGIDEIKVRFNAIEEQQGKQRDRITRLETQMNIYHGGKSE